MPTQPKATKVIGSGGRLRTVYVCAFGCWHNSMGQALKCKNAASLWACTCLGIAEGDMFVPLIMNDHCPRHGES